MRAKSNSHKIAHSLLRFKIFRFASKLRFEAKRSGGVTKCNKVACNTRATLLRMARDRLRRYRRLDDGYSDDDDPRNFQREYHRNADWINRIRIWYATNTAPDYAMYWFTYWKRRGYIPGYRSEASGAIMPARLFLRFNTTLRSFLANLHPKWWAWSD